MTTVAPLVDAQVDALDARAVSAAVPRSRFGSWAWLRARLYERYDRKTDSLIAERERRWLADMRAELRVRWREACERPQLTLTHGLTVPANGFGPARAPLVHDITIGDTCTPTTLIVELRPGQLVEDLEDAGRELAAALLCHRLRFEPVGGPFVRVQLVPNDPHAEVVTDAELICGTIALGPDEYGIPVRLTPDRLPHVAVQGQTGSGKSVSLYWLLRQMHAMPGTRIAGIDPSGLVFRPLPEDRLRVSGLSDMNAIMTTLAALCHEMDTRIARMPWHADVLPCGPGTDDSWLFIVLEELPGLLAALAAGVDRKTAELAKLYISRLAAEGRKTGLRLVMVAQRFDANSTAGAAVRANCGLRVSFRVENRAAVEFLHDDAPPDVVAEHIQAAPGVALVSAPGQPLRRVRFPAITYREWATAARCAQPCGRHEHTRHAPHLAPQLGAPHGIASAYR